MPETFTYQFDTPAFKGASTINTGLFIGGKWVDSIDRDFIECVVLSPIARRCECLDFDFEPVASSIPVGGVLFFGGVDTHLVTTATGTRITRVVAASAKDIDIAVDTAKQVRSIEAPFVCRRFLP